MAAAAALLGASAASAEPWRLEDAIAAPDWLSISGETRIRYESLGGQFRAGGTGGDQGLFLRTLLKVEVDAGAGIFGVELQDSRAYLTDDDTPLSPGFVDPLDVLQAYVRFDAPRILGDGSTSTVTLGRQTIDIAARRQVARFGYANVIRSYTGAYYQSTNPRGDELHMFFVSPLDRRPAGRPALDENRLQMNREQFGRRLFGVHYRRADVLPGVASDIFLENFLYGFYESDRENAETPNRNYLTPGGRLYRAPAPGRIDIDIEGAFRFGTRRATSDPADITDLDVAAGLILARAGYTFDAPWRPRIALQYFRASGDDNPNDNRFGRYERLFEARRGDLNHTSLHGPLTFSNISAPGVRLDVKSPAKTIDARLHYSAAFLASATDSWVIARRRDPTGQSGRFIGHTLDGRARYHWRDQAITFEVGGSALVHGRFAREAPDPSDADLTLYGYLQATAKF